MLLPVRKEQAGRAWLLCWEETYHAIVSYQPTHLFLPLASSQRMSGNRKAFPPLVQIRVNTNIVLFTSTSCPCKCQHVYSGYLYGYYSQYESWCTVAGGKSHDPLNREHSVQLASNTNSFHKEPRKKTLRFKGHPWPLSLLHWHNHYCNKLQKVSTLLRRSTSESGLSFVYL